MAALPSVPPVLLSEPAALDLVNTRLYIDGAWVDLLDDPGLRAQWLTAEAERLAVPTTAGALRGGEVAGATRVVRDHVAAAMDPARRGTRPPATAITGLNRAAAAAPAVPRARWDGSTLVTTAERDGTLAARLAAAFAEAAIELLAGPDVRRVRRCEAPECVVMFLARHPNRRWCTPDVCGNRARVSRYYLRHKTGPGGTGETAEPLGTTVS